MRVSDEIIAVSISFYTSHDNRFPISMKVKVKGTPWAVLVVSDSTYQWCQTEISNQYWHLLVEHTFRKENNARTKRNLSLVAKDLDITRCFDFPTLSRCTIAFGRRPAGGVFLNRLFYYLLMADVFICQTFSYKCNGEAVVIKNPPQELRM